jgi:hypothetical protein
MIAQRLNASALVVVAAGTLSACATPARLYSDTELSTVGRACGLAAGDLLQEAEEPRLLFLFRPGATPRERTCVARWSRRHGLHMAYVEAVQVKEN